jgi:long-chain acyl-CoA synthetase
MANFYDHVAQAVERYPDAVAVEMLRQDASGRGLPPEQETYRELRRRCEAVGRRLKERGLTPGARCALLAQNGPRWLHAYLGTIAAGAIVVPLDTNFNAGQIAKLLKDSGSTILFADGKNGATAILGAKDLPIEILLLEDDHEAADSVNFSCVPAEDGDTAAILYTSGTTSDPKGVMLTHGGLAAEMAAVFGVAAMTTEDALLGVLPLFHVLSQMANLLLPLAVGARVVFLETVNTSELLRALGERGITLFVCVPQFFYLIHDRIHKEVAARGRAARAAFAFLLAVSALGRRFGVNLGKLFFRPIHRQLGLKLRYLCTGGSRIDPKICREFSALGFELLQAYGLTETTGAVFATPTTGIVAGSVGQPMLGVKAKIIDPKPLEEAGGRQAGEIVVSGPSLMKGYYNRADATAQVLKDGWFHTGDLGYQDERGNLFIAGRIKEMIVLSSGKNIYPEEIEAHYAKSPFIKEVCILGIQSLPGQPFSERLHGVIVPDFDILRERKIVNAREVIRFDLESLSAELPSTKRILSYDLWQDPLPRTTTRKIKRFDVARRVRAAQESSADGPAEAPRELTDEERSWSALPDVQRALAVIRAAAPAARHALHPRDNIELDLGLDSMERVELLYSLERKLEAHIEQWSAAQVFTVRELVDVVRAHIGAAGAAGARPAWEALLNEPGLPEPEAADIIVPRPLSDLAWKLFFRAVNLVARAVYGLRVSGLDNIPKEGPFIVCPNHQSFLDGPVLVSALPSGLFKDLFYVGTSEIFGAGLARRLARSLRLVPIDPDVNLVSAMKAGAFGLAHGRILVLFPEGERSIDGLPKTFKKGAAILSAHLRVPIVPVALEGFAQAWPRGKRLRLTGDLRIVFGTPILPPERAQNSKTEADYTAMTAELRTRVMTLWSGLRGG